MLRNLLLAGLTALLVTPLASPAGAAARSGGPTRKPDVAVHHGQPAADSETERPVRPVVPVKKKRMVGKARARARASGRAVKRVRAAIMNQGLIRQSWTVADLNPMPALLDLDDTAQNLRRATAEIVRMMTR